MLKVWVLIIHAALDANVIMTVDNITNEQACAALGEDILRNKKDDHGKLLYHTCHSYTTPDNRGRGRNW